MSTPEEFARRVVELENKYAPRILELINSILEKLAYLLARFMSKLRDKIPEVSPTIEAVAAGLEDGWLAV